MDAKFQPYQNQFEVEPNIFINVIYINIALDKHGA